LNPLQEGQAFSRVELRPLNQARGVYPLLPPPLLVLLAPIY